MGGFKQLDSRFLTVSNPGQSANIKSAGVDSPSTLNRNRRWRLSGSTSSSTQDPVQKINSAPPMRIASSSSNPRVSTERTARQQADGCQGCLEPRRQQPPTRTAHHCEYEPNQTSLPVPGLKPGSPVSIIIHRLQSGSTIVSVSIGGGVRSVRPTWLPEL